MRLPKFVDPMRLAVHQLTTNSLMLYLFEELAPIPSRFLLTMSKKTHE